MIYFVYLRKRRKKEKTKNIYIKSIVLSIFTTNSNGTLSSECLIQRKFELCVFTLPTYTPTQIISFQYSKEYLPSTKVCILLLFMLSKENWYAALSPLTAFIISIAWILFFWYVKYFLVSGCISVVDCFVIFHHFAIENFYQARMPESLLFLMETLPQDPI